MNERTGLLERPSTQDWVSTHMQQLLWKPTWACVSWIFCVCVPMLVVLLLSCRVGPLLLLNRGWDIPIVSSSKNEPDISVSLLPEPAPRCAWVEAMFEERDGPDPFGTRLKETYEAQSTNFNVFYRATAHIFWSDYVHGNWGDYTRSVLADLQIHLDSGVPLSPKSTWTWVTGDQHLSNFGAWRNRHGVVVFSVNDFDEAAIFDFHIDVLRIAVSIHNHARANGFDELATGKTIRAFTKSYVDTVLSYVGNNNAELFELTTATAHGSLQAFLKGVEMDNSATKQLLKFTDTDPVTGLRCFLKGNISTPHPKTKLAALSSEMEEKVRKAFNATGYGATMMKLGWNVRDWDDDYFSVLDVAARIGSGVGSYGVDRYYLLLKGTDSLLKETQDGSAVILDVKSEPKGAVEVVLSTQDLAWYRNIFRNSADRAVQGQRRLTSFVDPFTGWISLDDDNDGIFDNFVVRQRSPWKEGFDLSILSDPDEFRAFAEQIAIATATSHVRGSVAKAPAEFKNVIDAIMHESQDRKEWGKGVENFAQAYHQQVLLDYKCFCQFIERKYGVRVQGN